MEPLASQRCFNHAAREAVARCPECVRFFCRECVTEHDDRVVCSACLKRSVQVRGKKHGRASALAGLVQCAVGILIMWGFFYLLGQALLSVPASFHEGSVWSSEEAAPQ